jgi:hypothetical protein
MSANAAIGSATTLRISKTDANGNDATAFIANWISGALNPGVNINMHALSNPSIAAFLMATAIVDNTTWYALTIPFAGALVSSGTFTNNMPISVGFTPRPGAVVVNSQPSNPTGTTDTTGKMMGLAVAFTPLSSFNALIVISGTIFNAGGIGDGAKARIYHGTGTAPTNGAALTGTADTPSVQFISSTTAEKVPFTLNFIGTGFTPGTAYWFDVALAAITGGTATITDLNVSVHELP